MPQPLASTAYKGNLYHVPFPFPTQPRTRDTWRRPKPLGPAIRTVIGYAVTACALGRDGRWAQGTAQFTEVA